MRSGVISDVPLSSCGDWGITSWIQAGRPIYIYTSWVDANEDLKYLYAESAKEGPLVHNSTHFWRTSSDSSRMLFLAFESTNLLRVISCH